MTIFKCTELGEMMQKINGILLLNMLILVGLVYGKESFDKRNIIMDERIFDTAPFRLSDEEDDEYDDYYDYDDDEDDDDAEDSFSALDGERVNLMSGNGDSDKNQSDEPNQTHLDIEPCSIVNGSVNVINGCYLDSEVDFMIPGAEPIFLERNYVSTDTDERGPFGKGWNRNHFGIVERKRYRRPRKTKRHEATVLESGGAMYQYGGRRRYSFKMLPKSYEDAVTNCGSGKMSGRTNIKNNILDYEEDEGTCIFNKSSGERLFFTQHKHRYTWRLTRELKANGNQFTYTYLDDGRLGLLKCLNRKGKLLDKLNFEYGRNDKDDFVFINHEGRRKVSYRLKRYRGKKTKSAPYIVEVNRKDAPKVGYKYEDKHDDAYIARIVRKNKPEGRFQEIKYYKRGRNYVAGRRIKIKHETNTVLNRVMEQRAPVGHDSTPIVTHSYIYDAPQDKDGHALVYDAYNHLTKYQWDAFQRLRRIQHFTGKGPYNLYRADTFMWGNPWGDSNTFLLAKSRSDANGTAIYMRTFKYDDSGNVITEGLHGNLSGGNTTPCVWDYKNGRILSNGCERYCKFFTYTNDNRYLMKSLTEGRVVQSFSYQEGTDLLASKFYSDVDKGIFKREFYFYDENAVLIKEIEDDGTTTDPENLQGASERRIRYTAPRQESPIGLPDVIEEKYVDVTTGEEHLLKKMVHQYDRNGHLILKEIYDANECYLCSFAWEYDKHGNVTKEVNPLGQAIIRSYDANDNKVFEQGINPNVHKKFVYDYSNRLIRVDEIYRDGLVLSESYLYNYLSQKVGVIDIYGNETKYRYDDLGRKIQEILPPVPDSKGALKKSVVDTKYTLLNAVHSQMDCNGNLTRIDYNVRSQPIKKLFADGTVEEMRYNFDGTLRKHTQKNGSYTVYRYDPLKRITSKKTYSSDGEELESNTYQYSTFHLLSEKDTAGHIKNYRYDSAGRLSEIVEGEKRKVYNYDSIGRLCKTIEYGGAEDCVSSIQVFDLMDRVIEERREGQNNELLTRVTYEYDLDGNRSAVTTYSGQGESVLRTVYDDRHQPVEIIDALGNATRIQYRYDYCNEHGQIVPYSISYDPMGNSTENIKDVQGRLVRIILKNSFGQLIHSKKMSYDKNGNKCRQEDISTHNPGNENGVTVTSWAYDCMNRIISITEAVGEPEQRHTEFRYNEMGQISEMIKPDGVRISFTYNALGYLKTQIASDGSVEYHYFYDKNGNLEKVEDKTHQTESSCSYDAVDRLTTETLSNGLRVEYAYDKVDRPARIIFPDGSGIQYVYEGHRLKEVHRLSQEKESQYSHHYLSYDEEDKLIESKLVGNAGKGHYQYDRAGRTTAIQYDSWEEKIETYDAVGNILSRVTHDPHGNFSLHYSYDDLFQLKEENIRLAKDVNLSKNPQKNEDKNVSKDKSTRTYAYDSFYNRTSKNGCPAKFNKLNQLVEDDDHLFEYDLNGNLIKKKSKAFGNGKLGESHLSIGISSGSEPKKSSTCFNGLDEVTYHYDALDRLVLISTNEMRVRYTYDFQNRRVSKEIEQWSNEGQSWKCVKINYLYTAQNEIGSYDSNGQAIELRLLGIGKGAEIGAAVAIELEGMVYAPLHDQQGNVTALIDAYSGKIVESYVYTAFGEESLFNGEGKRITESANPWRFSSKRVDSETGFVYFGRRYYEPTTSRWITPDPIGREGGPNLYAYVSNRPLIHFDMYGLFETGGAGFGNPFTAICSFVATFLNDFSKFVVMGVQYAGKVVRDVGYHLVPVPVVRDALQIAGGILSGDGLGGYHFAFCGENVFGWTGGWNYNPSQAVCVIGGILTPGDDVRERAEEESARLGGCNVHYFASASDGAVLDFLKAGIRRIGIPIPGDELLANSLKGLHESLSGGQEEGIIHTLCHSQGSLVLHNSEDNLGIVCKSMDVYTFGGAKILNKETYRSVTNFINEKDLIPFVSNPFAFTGARYTPRSDIMFLKSKEGPLAAHPWTNENYQNEISGVNKAIRKRMGF